MEFAQALARRARSIAQTFTRRHVGSNPPTEIREGHIPRTEVYEPDDVIVDLLDVAAKTLVLEGRIAYLLPTYGECGFRVDLM